MRLCSLQMRVWTAGGSTVTQIYPAGDRRNEKGPSDRRVCIITLITCCRYRTFVFDDVHRTHHRTPYETDRGSIDSERESEWLTGETGGL